MRTFILFLIIAAEFGTTLITACCTPAPVHSDDAGSRVNTAAAFDGDIPEGGGSQSAATDRTVYDPEPSAAGPNGFSNTDSTIPVNDEPTPALNSAFPGVTAANRAIWLGRTIGAMSFLNGAAEISDATARYKELPDFSVAGTQEITVILEDSQGNSGEFNTTLTIICDTVQPIITGAADQTIFIGDSISYRSGVTAYDNADGAIDFSVDSSAVNTYEAGNYDVIYSAVDSAGNVMSLTVTVSVIEVNTDVVYATADNILARIITPDMSLLDKARSIHSWIRGNMTYTGHADKSSVISGAYDGFRTRQGDCFTYYAIAEVLLTRAGIPNMRVTRLGGVTQHFWNLINVGTGWYHFDATPTRERINNFMFTSVQAESFTRLISQVPNYYVYDKSLYPAVVGDVIEQEVRGPRRASAGIIKEYGDIAEECVTRSER